MKNDQTNSTVNSFTVIDRLDETNVIAVRQKISVHIDDKCKEVKMHDYSYTFDEIIAVADKLKTL